MYINITKGHYHLVLCGILSLLSTFLIIYKSILFCVIQEIGCVTVIMCKKFQERKTCTMYFIRTLFNDNNKQIRYADKRLR